MRDELGEWTIKGELPIHVGKMIEYHFIFLSSLRQALKTKLGRRRFQKPVPIVQNKFLAYLVYVIQTGLFLGGFFLSTYANVRPCVFLLLQ